MAPSFDRSILPRPASRNRRRLSDNGRNVMTPRTLDITGVVFVVLAVLGWLLIAVNLLNLGGKSGGAPDAAMGKALSTFLTLLFVGLIWLLMGVLLLRAGAQDVLAGWASVAAFVLYLLSGAATIAAIFLLDDPKRAWLAAVPILTPLLIIGYVVCVYQPSLHQSMANPAIGGLVWAAVLLISLAPWPSVFRAEGGSAQRRAGSEEIHRQEAESFAKQQREEGLARIAKMPPDSHLWNWFSLLDAQSPVRSEAIAAFRTNPNRQADLEYTLGESIVSMECVASLDIEPTPKVCAGAAQWCRKFSQLMLPQNGQPSYYEEKQILGPSLDALRWFRAHGCSLDEGIAALEAGLQSYRPTPHRQQMLDQLRDLKK
jgi:hypothetical protein